MTKRVCLFMADLSGGGAERVMVNIGNGLAARGHDVDLLVARRLGPYSSAVAQDVRVRALSGRLSGAVSPLIGYIREYRPMCILAAGEHACAIAVVARYLGCRRTRLVLSLHNAIQPLTMAPKKIKDRITPSLVRYFYPAADRIVAVCNELRDDALRFIGGNASQVVAIYNPLFSDELVRSAKVPANHPWLEHKQVPVIVAAGRLTLQKGFDTLLQAFALLRKRLAARLVILGEGPEHASLTALGGLLGIADSIDLVGFVANPYAYMSRADVFAMSSRWEGFGNVLVEALASGTQIVSTDCQYGPREVLDRGKYGTLVPIDNPAALANAIMDRLQHPLPAAQLVSRAREFSIERALDLYEDVLGLKV
jgi:glycosyltransferase involved in cell wall biosynthesis